MPSRRRYYHVRPRTQSSRNHPSSRRFPLFGARECYCILRLLEDQRNSFQYVAEVMIRVIAILILEEYMPRAKEVPPLVKITSWNIKNVYQTRGFFYTQISEADRIEFEKYFHKNCLWVVQRGITTALERSTQVLFFEYTRSSDSSTRVCARRLQGQYNAATAGEGLKRSGSTHKPRRSFLHRLFFVGY